MEDFGVQQKSINQEFMLVKKGIGDIAKSGAIQARVKIVNPLQNSKII